MDVIVVLWNTVSTNATMAMARENAILQKSKRRGEDVGGCSSEGTHSQDTEIKEI